MKINREIQHYLGMLREATAVAPSDAGAFQPFKAWRPGGFKCDFQRDEAVEMHEQQLAFVGVIPRVDELFKTLFGWWLSKDKSISPQEWNLFGKVLAGYSGCTAYDLMNMNRAWDGIGDASSFKKLSAAREALLDLCVTTAQYVESDETKREIRGYVEQILDDTNWGHPPDPTFNSGLAP